VNIFVEAMFYNVLETPNINKLAQIIVYFHFKL